MVHQKYDTLNVEQLQKYDEKKRKKIRKAELDLTFLMNWQALSAVAKFLSSIWLMSINTTKDGSENGC